MRKTALLSAIAVAAAALVAMTGCANDAGGNTAHVGATNGTKVSIMVGGLDKQIYLPFQLAQQLGYYKNAGLDVTLSNEPAGVNAETNLVAGKIDGVGGFYDHTQVLQTLGKSTESVVSMLQVPGEVVLCRTDLQGTITSAADWAGRNLGITDTGSSTDYLTQYITKKNGVDPTTTKRIGVQAGPTFVAAMQHKNIDCGMTTEPTVSLLLESKQAYILYDSRTKAGSVKTFGGAYPATSLYMATAFVQKNPATVQKLADVYVKTLKWIQGHDGTQLAKVMPADYTAGVGAAAYAKAFDNEKGMYNPTGIMPSSGPSTVNDVLQTNPQVTGKQVDLAKTFTDTFVKAAK